jgi:hypothetical protein
MRSSKGRRVGIAGACALPALACAAGPGWAAVLPDVLCGVAALVLVVFGVWLLALALVARDAGDFSLRRYQGGFGGTSTGWRVSQALARAATGVVVLLLALALGMARVPAPPHDDRTGAADEAKAAASAPASAASAPASAASR